MNGSINQNTLKDEMNGSINQNILTDEINVL